MTNKSTQYGRIAVDSGNGFLHAGTGRHYSKYRFTRHCPESQSLPTGNAVRNYQLYPDGSHANSGERMAGRSLWYPTRIHDRCELVHARLTRLCAFKYVTGVGYLSRDSGIGGAMMMPVARLALLRAYPRSELLPVLNFVTMLDWSAPFWVPYWEAFWSPGPVGTGFS